LDGFEVARVSGVEVVDVLADEFFKRSMNVWD